MAFGCLLHVNDDGLVESIQTLIFLTCPSKIHFLIAALETPSCGIQSSGGLNPPESTYDILAEYHKVEISPHIPPSGFDESNNCRVLLECYGILGKEACSHSLISNSTYHVACA
jgi:hypothetical protein